MLYKSTRGGETGVSFIDAVLRGLSKDGGLFVPEKPPVVDPKVFYEKYPHLTFPELATELLSHFISESEIPKTELSKMCTRAYGPQWRAKNNTPNIKLSGSPELKKGFVYSNSTQTNGSSSAGGNAQSASDDKYDKNLHPQKEISVLELFHGPTFAFKDVALQLLGELFAYCLEKRSKPGGLILGATSGDTGTAAVAGIRGKNSLSGVILYPHERVSKIQELQMLSFNTNCTAAEVKANCARDTTKTEDDFSEIKNAKSASPMDVWDNCYKPSNKSGLERKSFYVNFSI